MPIPRKGETKKDWMARCVPILIGEGKGQSQAVAICTNMFHRKGALQQQELTKRALSDD